MSPDAGRRKTRKARKSPEPNGAGSSPTSSPLPHPELTVQQRQHLRERRSVPLISLDCFFFLPSFPLCLPLSFVFTTSSVSYWVLLVFSGFYRFFFLGFTGFYWVSLGFTGFYWVLLGFTTFYWVILGFTTFYWVLLGFTGFYWVLLGFTWFN